MTTTNVPDSGFMLFDSVSNSEEDLWGIHTNTNKKNSNGNDKMALLGEEEEDDDDVGTESLSSSEEEEDEETDSEDEHDSDEDEESDDEDDDDSSDSSSLGSTIERMEAEAAANGRPPPRSSMVMLGLGNRAMSSRSIGSSSGTITVEPRPRGMRRNQKSAPNLLELDIPVAAAMVSTPQQKDSLRSFMARMNSAQLIMQHDADAHTVAETPAAKQQQDEPDTTTALINDGSNSTRSKVRKSRSANALGDMLKTERSSRDKNSPTRMLEQLWEQVILVESSTTTELTVATDHDDTNAPVTNKKPHARMKDWIPPAFWDTYFDLITEQRIDAYTRPIVTAMRALDLTTIKKIVAEHGPQIMNACNRQGESLMHLAFRRGNVDIINYMLHDVKASLTVRDDWNKTPLHDLCWYTKTNLENHGPRAWQCIVLHVMQHAPALFFARDRRGFLPLQYVPQECFGDWCKFLDDNNALLKWRIDYLDFQRIRFRLQKTLTRAKDQIKRQEERQQRRRQQAVEEQMTTTTTKEG